MGADVDGATLGAEGRAAEGRGQLLAAGQHRSAGGKVERRPGGVRHAGRGLGTRSGADHDAEDRVDEQTWTTHTGVPPSECQPKRAKPQFPDISRRQWLCRGITPCLKS